MRRSRSVVMTATVAVLAASLVSGCSLFGRDQGMGAAVTASDPTAEATGPIAAPPASAAATSSVTPLPANAPTPLPVTGYVLTQSSATVVRKFEAVAGKFNGVFSGLTVRNVSRGTTITGTVVLLNLHPELVGNAAIERGLLPGMIKGMAGQGARTTMQKVSGVDVAVASTKTTNIVAWYSKGTVVLVLGSGVDPAPTLAFVKAYLAVGAR